VTRRTLIITIGVLAMLAAVVLHRFRPTADAANRIRADYYKAEAPVLRPGSGLSEIDQFARDLRAIDLAGAPVDVEKAMNAMIVAVEGNAVDRRMGWNTNAANDRVTNAKGDLLRAWSKWRGQPFYVFQL
jgi:hypothetical protein